mgnify:FL=1
MNAFHENVTIEEHPWGKLYPKTSPINKLIVGSFPPNKMTMPTGAKMIYLDGIGKINEKEAKNFDFFYGWKQSSFWELFMSSLKLKIDKYDLEGIKNYLKQHKWGITDIVAKTTRKSDSPRDQDLVPKEWNKYLIEKVLKENKIKDIYFTSSWVRMQFGILINPELYDIENLVTLISPSRWGLRRFPAEALRKLPKHANESPQEYRRRYYNHVLSK